MQKISIDSQLNKLLLAAMNRRKPRRSLTIRRAVNYNPHVIVAKLAMDTAPAAGTQIEFAALPADPDPQVRSLAQRNSSSGTRKHCVIQAIRAKFFAKIEPPTITADDVTASAKLEKIRFECESRLQDEILTRSIVFVSQGVTTRIPLTVCYGGVIGRDDNALSESGLYALPEEIQWRDDADSRCYVEFHQARSDSTTTVDFAVALELYGAFATTDEGEARDITADGREEVPIATCGPRQPSPMTAAEQRAQHERYI